ncbi:MAG: hypothetical protein QY310_01020 [Candidatus Jettenia sp. CY-1]|nr:hypothetical protein [Candidatus Jettenia sp.]WKZ19155.1 MAG: hypothetical protein QY310_01020 [Candidatus Jettenia sp. CY-1]
MAKREWASLYVEWTIRDSRLEWNFLKEVIIREELLDGCYIIMTDVPSYQMGKQKIVTSYKKLTFVEQAFRNLKTVQLEVRPLYHKTDDRIGCHVFVCMLAYYYIQWHMKQRLKPLFESDDKNKYRLWTFENVIERLKSIRLQTLSVAGVECKIISDLEEDQQKILNYLAIRL